MFACEQARLDLEQIFGKEAQSLVAHLNIEGQHRGAVAAATAMQHHDSAHSHADSGPGVEHDPKTCKVCVDGHDHHHNHDHSHHDHGHAMAEEEGRQHDHSHAHGHNHDDKGKHEHHHHDHDHKRQETTAAERFGIRSFVYKRRLPFHPQRYGKTDATKLVSTVTINACC